MTVLADAYNQAVIRVGDMKAQLLNIQDRQNVRRHQAKNHSVPIMI